MRPQTNKELSLKEKLKEQNSKPDSEEELIQAIKDLAKSSRESSGESAKQMKDSLGVMIEMLGVIKSQKEQPISVEVKIPPMPPYAKKWRHTRVEMGKWISERVA